MPRRKEFKYEYEGGRDDFHYEESGATSEELQHKENCNWIYGDCDCGMSRNRQLRRAGQRRLVK